VNTTLTEIDATVLVTGATRGLGYEFVHQYAAQGWRVFACCRTPFDESSIDTLRCRFPGRIERYALDVTNSQSIALLRDELCKTSIDILINNAGVWGSGQQSLQDMDFDAWKYAFEVNAIGTFRVIQALWTNVRDSRQKKVIALSSEMGSITLGGSEAYAYRSSKAALNRVMKSAAEDLRREGISVLTLHPGWVQTDMGTIHAPLRPGESVAAMRQVIESLGINTTGRFLDLFGSTVPW
jgi:NAD(P)-dependent dehydrogenase (short-subunit alcohol dehydrogenase family)